jgi:hypothetical protein
VGDDYEILERPKTGQAWAGNYLPLLVALGIIAFLSVVVFRGKSAAKYEARRREARAKRHAGGSPPGGPTEDPRGGDGGTP